MHEQRVYSVVQVPCRIVPASINPTFLHRAKARIPDDTKGKRHKPNIPGRN